MRKTPTACNSVAYKIAPPPPDSLFHASPALLFLFHVDQVVLVRVHQRLPARVDDVPADADGPEDLLRPVRLLPAALDRHPHGRRRLVAAVDHPHLVVD